MGSCLRFIGVGLAVLLCSASMIAAPVPVPNAKFEPPTITIQAQNGQKLLDDFRKYLTLSGATPEMLVKLDATIKQLLGEKGFAGLDLKKPMGAYAYLREKVESSSFVLVLPITDEKSATDLLQRMHLSVTESKFKGVFELAGNAVEGMNTHLRFFDNHAYVSVNGGTESLSDTDKLVPISSMVDEKETAVVSATIFGKRVPKEFHAMIFPLLDEANAGVDQLQARALPGMPKSFPQILKEMLGWGRRSYELMVADGEAITVRALFDSKVGDLDFETTLTPKPKSALLADLKAFKPTRGRFQQLVTKDAVGGGWIVLPGPIPKGVLISYANFAAEGLPLLGKEMGLPPEFGPVFDALATSAQKALTAGDLDIGAALFGPTKDKHYTFVSAVAIDDPATLVDVGLAVVKDLPKEFAEAIKLNAYKIDDVAVHTVELDKLLPLTWLKIFGDKPKLNVAVANKGLFVAVGPDAEAELKRALALKPAETRNLDFLANLSKGKELTTTAGGNWGNIGNEIPIVDRLLSFYAFDVRGGTNLKIRSGSGQLAIGLMMSWQR